jgi:hypothetical protein
MGVNKKTVLFAIKNKQQIATQTVDYPKKKKSAEI